MSCDTIKPTKCHVFPAKNLICQITHQIWSKSLLHTLTVAKGLKLPPCHQQSLWSDDQIWQLPRLAWVFSGNTCHFVSFVMLRLKINFWFFTLYIWHTTKTQTNNITDNMVHGYIFMFSQHYSKFKSFGDFELASLKKGPHSKKVYSEREEWVPLGSKLFLLKPRKYGWKRWQCNHTI